MISLKPVFQNVMKLMDSLDSMVSVLKHALQDITLMYYPACASIIAQIHYLKIQQLNHVKILVQLDILQIYVF